ncbi:MAG: hypothetical protein RL721_545 [Candidatus Eisenbacteria bacterium]
MTSRRLPPLRPFVLVAFLALALGGVAQAATPQPIANPAFGFPVPGDAPAPSNAASAGLALADRWLGETAFENPAAGAARGFALQVSPVFQRVNRQDLASTNRSTVQKRGYPDVAGGALAYGTTFWSATLYAWHPVLRLEQLVYESGPIATPASVSQEALQRELRAGLALSFAMGDRMRVGVAGEYVDRRDSYTAEVQSGGPSSGTRSLTLEGSGMAASAGLTYANDPDRPWGSWFGAAVHWQGELDLDGAYEESLILGDSTGTLATTRSAAFSGGASARLTVAPATRVVVGLSANAGQDWTGFDRATDAGLSYGIGLDWKTPELPWGVRFGVGQERNPGALEERAGLLSVGFTLVSGDMVFDLGLLHRNLERSGFARSADDRAVGSVRIAF